MPASSIFAPELPVAEQVKIEALAHGRRLEAARQLSATVKGPGAQAYRFKDYIRELADQLDAEDELERRRAEERALRTPSALIARMRADWPGQARAVKRLADGLGIGLGEAWAMTIRAGVRQLTKHPRRKA